MKSTIKNQSNVIPLIIILVGTSLLALPSAFGTFVLMMGLVEGDTSPTLKTDLAIRFLVTSIIGFAIFFGYIWTVIKQKYNAFLWSISAIYNLYLATVYGRHIASHLATGKGLLDNEFTFYPPLLLIWTLFVALASIYYIYFSLRSKSTTLP